MLDSCINHLPPPQPELFCNAHCKTFWFKFSTSATVTPYEPQGGLPGCVHGIPPSRHGGGRCKGLRLRTPTESTPLRFRAARDWGSRASERTGNFDLQGVELLFASCSLSHSLEVLVYWRKGRDPSPRRSAPAVVAGPDH